MPLSILCELGRAAGWLAAAAAPLCSEAGTCWCVWWTNAGWLNLVVACNGHSLPPCPCCGPWPPPTRPPCTCAGTTNAPPVPLTTHAWFEMPPWQNSMALAGRPPTARLHSASTCNALLCFPALLSLAASSAGAFCASLPSGPAPPLYLMCRPVDCRPTPLIRLVYACSAHCNAIGFEWAGGRARGAGGGGASKRQPNTARPARGRGPGWAETAVTRLRGWAGNLESVHPPPLHPGTARRRSPLRVWPPRSLCTVRPSPTKQHQAVQAGQWAQRSALLGQARPRPPALASLARR